MTGKGTPIRQVLGKSKMLLGLLEGLPTMLKGEVAMVLASTFCNLILELVLLLTYVYACVAKEKAKEKEKKW